MLTARSETRMWNDQDFRLIKIGLRPSCSKNLKRRGNCIADRQPGLEAPRHRGQTFGQPFNGMVVQKPVTIQARRPRPPHPGCAEIEKGWARDAHDR